MKNQLKSMIRANLIQAGNIKPAGGILLGGIKPVNVKESQAKAIAARRAELNKQVKVIRSK